MSKVQIPIVINVIDENEYVDFIMPHGEEIRIEITGYQDYYPEDKDTYRYPNNPDGTVYDLGDETYSFIGAWCVYDDDKIKLRRALVRAFVKENCYKNWLDGNASKFIELSQSYYTIK